ncbi:MAG TPA: superoxide dismutase [Burkholderiales bacterium]
MKEYVLPDLPYDYGALEPHVSAEIMRLHHDKHHQAYVTGANQALAALEEARAKNDYTRIAALEHLLAFNVSGHVLHSLFWQNLGPNGGGEPGGALANQIKTDFGSFANFKNQMTRAAATITGSGWAALAWDPAGGRLIVVQIHDHQSETAQGSLPIMVLDAWEHAYYLQYKNEKAKFFDAVWNIWNWKDIEARFDAVRNVNLALRNVVQGA